MYSYVFYITKFKQPSFSHSYGMVAVLLFIFLHTKVSTTSTYFLSKYCCTKVHEAKHFERRPDKLERTIINHYVLNAGRTVYM